MSDSLEATAQALVAAGKGILAADESAGTISKRFAARRHRLDARRTAAPIARCCSRRPSSRDFISGVILYDETIRQYDGRRRRRSPRCSTRAGHHPRHQGRHAAPKPLAACPGEMVTEGLDGLRERLAEYRALGARFAKWRAVITIGDGCRAPLHRRQRPRARALRGAVPGGRARADRRARGADGRRRTRSSAAPRSPAHVLTPSSTRCAASGSRSRACCSSRTWSWPARTRPSAAGGGSGGGDAALLRRFVPAAVPGVVFLSGGQEAGAAAI